MGKLLVFVLGLAVLLGTAYAYLNRNGRSATGTSEPKRALDQVRSRASEIEKDAQQRADELIKRTE